MQDTKKIVEIQNLSMIYHTPKEETLALKDISFDVFDGEFLSIIGPSGCGKSTVLSLISGLLKPSCGQVRIFGNPVEKPSSSVAYMFQHDHLFDWRTIEQNVLLGLEVRGQCTAQAREHAIELLCTYGLRDFLHHYPGQLSGGMRQKVALIRTLAVSPQILLLDEPFSALDYQTRLTVSEEIAHIIKNEKKTAILVTHDISEAISLSDRVLMLSNRPSVIKMQTALEFDLSEDTPFNRRQAPEFQHYFDLLWKELDVHVEQ